MSDLDDPRCEVLVLGIGNLLWADEGFGVRCVEALQARHTFAPHVRLVDGGTQGLYLIPHVNGAGRLLILDAVGGRSLKQGYDLLAPAGRLVCFGVSAMAPGKSRSVLSALSAFLAMPRFGPVGLMNDNRTVSGVNMGHLFDRLDLLMPQFEALLAMYERGEIKPHVDRTFSFSEAAAAHHHLHDRKAKGKVLLVP